jgi:hypothetical protein
LPSSLPDQSPQGSNEKVLIQALEDLHTLLKTENIRVEALAVCHLSPNDMIFGEVYNFEDYFEPDKVAGSIFGLENFVAIKNPKRLVRMTAQPRPGEFSFHFIFSDFDMVESGTIEVRPISAFFLSWLSLPSQINYCQEYISWIDGKRMATYKAAGLVIPDGMSSVSDTLKNIRDRLKGK